MATATEQDEYLAEIRREVCSRCIEKPPGGPPCAPLGKACGIELHLPQLIESIHQVRSPMIAPYLEHNRQEICAKCAFLHSDICPCPMDYLAVLLVGAVEEVDKRRAEREGAQSFREVPSLTQGAIAEIGSLYETASRCWIGCDWPTEFGKTGLNLQNRTAREVRIEAEKMSESQSAEDWRAAADWLACVERYAIQANASAAAAVKALSLGNWQQAVDHAEHAWAVEFMTGRPLRLGKAAWRPFMDAVKAVYRAKTGDTAKRRAESTSAH